MIRFKPSLWCNRAQEVNERVITSDSVHAHVDQLFSDRVVSSRVVIRRVFFASDQLLRMEQLTIGSRTNLI